MGVGSQRCGTHTGRLRSDPQALWVVERTFAWICRNRRMSRDYEFLAETTEALIYVCMIRLILKRLVKEAA